MTTTIIATGGGGGGGSGSATGTLSIDVADAKLMLPAGTKNVWITFEQVRAHRSGGGWISLPLVQTPYTIELLQFYDGNSTELVPPVSLVTGKYTQIRIVIGKAEIKINNTTYQATIPSENLKTDKNFDFVVTGGGTVDIIVDFDLSKSVLVSGPSGTHDYILKPVLHIVKTLEAATIQGSISEITFDNNSSTEVTVTVIRDKDADRGLSPDDEEHTKVKVPKGNPATFSIFWLVPDQGFTVQIDMDGDLNPEFEEFVEAVHLQPGSIYDLNNQVAF